MLGESIIVKNKLLLMFVKFHPVSYTHLTLPTIA